MYQADVDCSVPVVQSIKKWIIDMELRGKKVVLLLSFWVVHRLAALYAERMFSALAWSSCL
jgi:hypothetical protein